MAYNLLSTLKAALAGVHGVGKVEAAVSDFYRVNEVQGIYRGMVIAIPAEHWQPLAAMTTASMTDLLKDLATRVDLKPLLKAPRKKKQKTKKKSRTYDPKHPHVSTAKLLSGG